MNECHKRDLQGVICGHIHHPEVSMINGICYGNSGDWVESCSALVEDFDGNLSIMRWTENHKASIDTSQPAMAEVA